jgi:tRNA pseudouridine38-40 synthase
MDHEARRNIKLVVAYNGRAYHGWQRQTDNLSTVQKAVEDAATDVMKHRVILHGAGRTDAGVHADGQVANFRTPNTIIPLKGLRRAINTRLPADIAIHSAQEVPMDFHASRSATGKTYHYRIHTAPTRPVALAGLVYHLSHWAMDVELMNRAARRLVGTHDFAGLATNGTTQRKTTVRTVFVCQVARVGAEIGITVQGDGFLYNMVRNIVGTLVTIGRGHWPLERVDEIIASRDRSLAGPTAPAEGLSLQCVHYDPASLALGE